MNPTIVAAVARLLLPLTPQSCQATRPQPVLHLSARAVRVRAGAAKLRLGVTWSPPPDWQPGAPARHVSHLRPWQHSAGSPGAPVVLLGAAAAARYDVARVGLAGQVFRQRTWLLLSVVAYAAAVASCCLRSVADAP
jgi:hypothetical protein